MTDFSIKTPEDATTDEWPKYAAGASSGEPYIQPTDGSRWISMVSSYRDQPPICPGDILPPGTTITITV